MSQDFVSRRAVVTGASGFIGGRLRDALLDDGYDVVSLTRPGSPQPRRGRSAPVDYHDAKTLDRVMDEERPEIVFHLAGATKGVTYQDFRRANVVPTQNLLAALSQRHRSVRRFVYVSSLTAFGPSLPDRPKDEEEEPQPVEHYGRSKLEAERVVASSTDLPWTIIRPPAVYGPGDVDNFELFRLAARGLNLFYGNRDRHLSKIYVDDLVRGVRQAAEAESAVGKGYFLCDGEPLTWQDYQAEIVAQAGRRVLELSLPERLIDVSALVGELLTKLDKKPRLFNRQKAILGHQIAWTCRHDAARRDFGFRPEIALREGVSRTFAWYREAGWL